MTDSLAEIVDVITEERLGLVPSPPHFFFLFSPSLLIISLEPNSGACIR